MVELDRAEDVVDAIIERVGKDIRVGTPLAAGKPNHVLNALYRRAKADPTIQLQILSALTLEKPKGASDLESRFLGPFAERVFGGYPDLDYELDRKSEALPPNVRIIEFYFPPGKFVGNATAQRDYISSNYTHVVRDILGRGLNVLASQVAVEERDGERFFSLSCNPDVAVDAMYELRKMAAAGIPVCFVAQTNGHLPFMYGDAEVHPESFHLVVDNRDEDYPVFGPPKMSVSAADHMIGMHIAALVRDGGELQVGIGSIGDAVVNALRFRHRDNGTWREVLDELAILERFGAEIGEVGELGTFDKGLFSASEMMVDGFLQLFHDGIIKRKVYDHVGLQRLLNAGRITEEVTPETLRALVQQRSVGPVLGEEDVHDLRWFGVLDDAVRLEGDRLIDPGGAALSADLSDAANLAAVCATCLGTTLKHGAVMHAGFFLGPSAFYRGLRELPEAQRRLIRMRSVRRINQLFGHEEVDRLHRVDGRFVNTAMSMTLFGAACSDALPDGTVVSGVGGQYNFVAMAHELPGGRSILNLRSTRTDRSGELVSNVVLSVGHVTIPRHLRDMVVTEYGIANLRGKTDEECVMAMLNVADSRFQPALMAEAKAVGKLRPGYEIPEIHRMNLPERYESVVASFAEHFPAFPLGCDFDATELALGKALKYLKAKTRKKTAMAALVARAMTHRPRDEHAPYLARMGYEGKLNQHDRLYSRLVCLALDDTGTTA